MTPEQRQSDNPSVFRRSSRWKIMLGAGIVLVIVFWEFLWPIFKDVLSNFIPIMTTPVILEISLFFLGLSTVIVWNHYRNRKDEADEWVVLPEDEDGEK